MTATCPCFTCCVIGATSPGGCDDRLTNSQRLSMSALSLLPLSLTRSAVFTYNSSSLLTKLCHTLRALDLPSSGRALTPGHSLQSGIVIRQFNATLPSSSVDLNAGRRATSVTIRAICLHKQRRRFDDNAALLLNTRRTNVELDCNYERKVYRLYHYRGVDNIIGGVRANGLDDRNIRSVRAYVGVPVASIVLSMWDELLLLSDC